MPQGASERHRRGWAAWSVQRSEEVSVSFDPPSPAAYLRILGASRDRTERTSTMSLIALSALLALSIAAAPESRTAHPGRPPRPVDDARGVEPLDD